MSSHTSSFGVGKMISHAPADVPENRQCQDCRHINTRNHRLDYYDDSGEWTGSKNWSSPCTCLNWRNTNNLWCADLRYANWLLVLLNKRCGRRGRWFKKRSTRQ